MQDVALADARHDESALKDLRRGLVKREVMARGQKAVVELAVVAVVGDVLVRRVHLQNQRYHRRVQVEGQVGRRAGFAVLQQREREIGLTLRQVHFLALALFLRLFHGADQLVKLQGLVEVIDRIELDRVFQVFLIGITAEKQNLQRGVRGQHLVDERDAVELWHAHVAYDDVEVRVVNQNHGLQPVGRLADNLYIHHLPVHGFGDASAGLLRIIYNDHFIHAPTTPLKSKKHANRAFFYGTSIADFRRKFQKRPPKNQDSLEEITESGGKISRILRLLAQIKSTGEGGRLGSVGIYGNLARNLKKESVINDKNEDDNSFIFGCFWNKMMLQTKETAV